jgi:hypothetical protein
MRNRWDTFRYLSPEHWQLVEAWDDVTSDDDPVIERVRRTGSVAGSSLASVVKSGTGSGYWSTK